MNNLVFLFFAQCLCHAAIALNIGIGTANPDANSELDVSRNSKGVLIPRLTELQKFKFKSPATGLLIYNTTACSFEYYNGSAWESIIGSSSNYWDKNVNNIYKSNSGNVGNGTTTPRYALA